MTDSPSPHPPHHAARLAALQQRLEPLRQTLLEHPVYREIDSLAKLHQFMQHHVFAVWDFMCLLKTLQQRLTCTETPWLPPTDGATARLVNEIVLGEESDEDGAGGYASHFDLYHRAMVGCGAGTRTIDRFLRELRAGASLPAALEAGDAPLAVRRFVGHTFQVIQTGHLPAIAAAFTFGREDLLPDVFRRVVAELNVEAEGGLDDFRFYLHRHIELDGDHHGPLAARMICSLCGDAPERWQAAEQAAVDALQARLDLWEGMYEAMQSASTRRGLLVE